MIRLAILLLAVTVSAVFLAFGSVAQAGDPDTVHHPDLQTLQPDSLQIRKSGGQKLLRFGNTVVNLGRGRLELRAENNPVTDTTDAYQRLYSHDAAGNWYLASERYAGTFAFHEAHNHTHFGDFALYELRDVAADGSIGSQVLASSDKVTFCIIDTTLVDSSLEHYEGRNYTTCTQTIPQGLSVGWGDHYGRTLSGQNLNVTGLANGNYWLVSTADPDNRIDEGGGAAETNNSAAVKIRIRNNSVTVVQ